MLVHMEKNARKEKRVIPMQSEKKKTNRLVGAATHGYYHMKQKLGSVFWDEQPIADLSMCGTITE